MQNFLKYVEEYMSTFMVIVMSWLFDQLFVLNSEIPIFKPNRNAIHLFTSLFSLIFIVGRF